MAIVRTTKAPNLVISDREYNNSNEDQFRNQLRLYFNQVDTLSQNLLNANGGANLSFPHIAASHNDDQYATGDNTPTKVLWDTLEAGSGFTLNANSTATAQFSGTYKIDFALQLANTDNDLHDTRIWLEVDDVAVPRSTMDFTLQARKSAGVPFLKLAYSSITFSIQAGQSFALYWATEKAFETGVAEGVYLWYEAATTSPYVSPATPSATGSIVYVSRD